MLSKAVLVLIYSNAKLHYNSIFFSPLFCHFCTFLPSIEYGLTNGITISMAVLCPLWYVFHLGILHTAVGVTGKVNFKVKRIPTCLCTAMKIEPDVYN